MPLHLYHYPGEAGRGGATSWSIVIWLRSAKHEVILHVTFLTIQLYVVYHKLPKIRPPFLHTTFRQKWGGGICSNIQFVSYIRPLPPFFMVLSTRTQIRQLHDDCRAASLNVLLLEISSACVDTKLRGTKATCIVCGNRGRLCANPCSQCNLSGGEEMRRQYNFVRTHLRTWSMMI